MGDCGRLKCLFINVFLFLFSTESIGDMFGTSTGKLHRGNAICVKKRFLVYSGMDVGDRTDRD